MGRVLACAVVTWCGLGSQVSKTVTVGGETFELYHAKGETDDATWVFVPQRKVRRVSCATLGVLIFVH